MSLLNTRMQNMRSESNLDKNELRPSRYGALNMFMYMTKQAGGIITPELIKKAEKSIGRTLEVPVIDYDGTISIGNTRTVTIQDSENTSQMLQITFTTYAWGFTMVPSLFMNNEVGAQADFETKFKKYLYAFGNTLDSGCIASLEAAKTQVIADSLNYGVTANVIEAAWSERENFIGDIDPIMAANDHFAGIQICGNGGLESLINKLQQKGLYNEVNKQNEYMDKTVHFTKRITNEAGDNATMFAVQDGSLGILTRFEREAILNTKTKDGHEWNIDSLPMLNFPVGTYFYESVGNSSGIAGAASADMDRVRKEHYGFAVDVAYVTPYNSDPANIASPIYKAVIKSKAVSDALDVNIVNTAANPVYTDEVP